MIGFSSSKNAVQFGRSAAIALAVARPIRMTINLDTHKRQLKMTLKSAWVFRKSAGRANSALLSRETLFQGAPFSTTGGGLFTVVVDLADTVSA
ncbi:MAG: hypothetical protein AAF917_02120, partial [Pseudomonadota bacterium]